MDYIIHRILKVTAKSSFDDMKNDEGLYRLRVHSEENMEGKLFIAFVALTIKMEITGSSTVPKSWKTVLFRRSLMK